MRFRPTALTLYDCQILNARKAPHPPELREGETRLHRAMKQAAPTIRGRRLSYRGGADKDEDVAGSRTIRRQRECAVVDQNRSLFWFRSRKLLDSQFGQCLPGEGRRRWEARRQINACHGRKVTYS
jgi:hypothetical protein